MLKPTTCTVYALVSSSEPSRVRYIGQTVKALKTRLLQHHADAARTSKSHRPVACWIRAQAARGGRKLSPEHIAASSLGRKGIAAWNKGITYTDEQRAKLMVPHKARVPLKHSEETKARMSASASVRKASPETRKRMSESIKASWEKRRAQA